MTSAGTPITYLVRFFPGPCNSKGLVINYGEGGYKMGGGGGM